MSSSFYDHSRYFSPLILYGRCESEDFIPTVLFCAFGRSLQSHLTFLRDSPSDDRDENSVERAGGL